MTQHIKPKQITAKHFQRERERQELRAAVEVMTSAATEPERIYAANQVTKLVLRTTGYTAARGAGDDLAVLASELLKNRATVALPGIDAQIAAITKARGLEFSHEGKPGISEPIKARLDRLV